MERLANVNKFTVTNLKFDCNSTNQLMVCEQLNDTFQGHVVLITMIVKFCKGQSSSFS